MINIKDIQAQRIKNPEPNEVKRIRALITDYFKDLVFIEDSHQYFLGDRELRPVSSVCHSFEPYVDWDSIAENKAKKLGKTKEELQEEWHQKNITSTSCGSKTHYFGEQMMNLFIGRDVNLPFQYTRDGYIIPYCPKEKAIESYYTNILNNPNVYPIMPEAKIFLTDYKGKQLSNPYAGTFDILLGYRMKDGSIKTSIHDFKSNATLINDFNRSKSNRLLAPFQDFIDEPLSMYSIQLSLYQLGLESIGIEVVDRNLIWLKEDGTYEKISTPDLTLRILNTL